MGTAIETQTSLKCGNSSCTGLAWRPMSYLFMGPKIPWGWGGGGFALDHSLAVFIHNICPQSHGARTNAWTPLNSLGPYKQAGMTGMPTCITDMFCAAGGICLVNRSEQAAGSFVIGRGAGHGLPTERTYEHQQHPAPFSGGTTGRIPVAWRHCRPPCDTCTRKTGFFPV